MLLYSKCVNEETNEYIVINQIEAKKLGWVEHEIELAYDGKFYLEGHAPEKQQSEINAERIAELESYLSATDWYAIRESETGVDIPAEVKKARADARAEISSLRGDKEPLAEPIENIEELPVAEEEVVPQIENTIEEID